MPDPTPPLAHKPGCHHAQPFPPGHQCRCICTCDVTPTPPLAQEAAERVARRITARYAMALNALNSIVAQKRAESGTLDVDVLDLLTDLIATTAQRVRRETYAEAAGFMDETLAEWQVTPPRSLIKRPELTEFIDEFRRRATGG